ncbi:MAG TPA: response regulator [Flavisolibacter sp.]|nr:response regulator [Flavisolibacter sp.]
MSTTIIPKILYVDDDSDDCIFLSESFAATKTDTDLVCASGGEEAIKYLNSIQQQELPSLIILDLNMPKWDGRQTLNYIKSKPQLADIPVVILSTSENKMDKEVCKRLGAASYLQKPYHYDGYKDVVKNCMPLIKVHE